MQEYHEKYYKISFQDIKDLNKWSCSISGETLYHKCHFLANLFIQLNSNHKLNRWYFVL